MGPRPGIYGKLPSNGDFVTRRLPAAFVDPWDQWLRESISDSRDRLGDRWLDVYLTSPVWRFALSAGAAGQEAWAGLLMPSVDRVGRYFPLTLACPLSAGGAPTEVMAEARAWYDAAEKLLLSCLEDDLDLLGVDRQVQALGAPRCTRGQGLRVPTLASASRMSLPEDLAAVCPAVLNQALSELFFAYSLWWSQGSDCVEPSLLLCQGLPPSRGFAAMLAGEWPASGWGLATALAAGDGSVRPPAP
jgi:type VI secretion system protein ImpM